MIYIEKFILILFITIVTIFIVENLYKYKSIIYNMLLQTALLIFLILILKEFKPIKKLLLKIIKLPLSFINKLLTEEDKEIKDQYQTSILHDEIYKKIDKKKIEPILNIINTHQSKEFFSMALVGQWGIGKSSYLYNLKKELQNDNYEVVYINVWELEDLSNILKEVEKEFDNILFNNSLVLWINKLFYSIVGKDYFSIISKYFTKSSISLDVGLTPTLNEAKKHYNSLLNQIVSKKIILCIDEVDRLDNKNDILDVFKVIRYLTSFDSIFTITAIDIKQLENKLDNIEYIHKIFNLKYILPQHTKSELAKFLKDDIYDGLKDFVNKDDFKKLIDYKEQNTKQTIMSVFNNYREVKNSFNDTYLMIHTLKSQNTEWNKYIRWEFIFILSIIKSTNFNMYLKIMKDDNLVTIFDNLYKKDDMTARLLEKDTSFKDIFENLQQCFDKNVLKPISILYHLLFTDRKNFEQYLYIYKHYKVYDFLITEEKYQEIINNVNIIDNKLNDIHIIEEKTEFLLRLIEIISRDRSNQFNILKKIIEIIQNNNDIDFKNVIKKIVDLNLANEQNKTIFESLIKNNQDIAFEFIDKLLDRFSKNIMRKSMNESTIISLIKSYLENNDEQQKEKNLCLLQYIDINFKDEIGCKIRKIFYEYYKNSEYSGDMISWLLLSVYDKELNKLFESLEVKIDDIIQDDHEYQIWESHSGGASTKYIYGKELKEILQKTQQNLAPNR